MIGLMIAVGIISILTCAFCLYHFIIALFGFKNPILTQKTEEIFRKYTVVIAARDEEKVIANLIDSLNKQNYPKDCFNVIVIADNCTDSTADVARNAGARVFVRNDLSHATKGAALNGLFSVLFDEPDFDSDAIVFFDADNVVDRDYLKNVNIAFNNGSQMVQGFRDAKNPYDSWVSGAYAIYFLTITRFCLQARVNAGLSAFIGGTGFAVKSEILKQFSWDTKEISEDIEFSLYRISAGYKIDVVREAKFYDEQPVTFKDSWRQRVRWTTGIFRCLFTCFPSLWKGRKINPRGCFDGFMYLMSVPNVFLGILCLILSAVLSLAAGKYFLYGIVLMIASWVLSLLAMAFAAILVLALEKKDIKKNIKGIVGFPIFLVTFMACTVVSVIKPVKSWERIKHNKDAHIEDM